MKMKSWKTTVGGVLAAIGAALPAIGQHLMGVDLNEVGAVLGTLGLAFMGIASRDYNVTSEGKPTGSGL